MKSNLLFLYSFKKWGWALAVPSIALGLAVLYFEFQFSFLKLHPSTPSIFSGEKNNLTDELALVGSIIGLCMVAFSAEKVEDEYIAFERMKSLQWAVYANYLVLLLAVIAIYGTTFMDVLIYNIFTILIIFIARFHFIL